MNTHHLGSFDWKQEARKNSNSWSGRYENDVDPIHRFFNIILLKIRFVDTGRG